MIEFAACLATGHIVAWLVQFFLTLWFNTFLVVASHDFEESNSEAELAVIPEPLRDDWAARQICLSYDLSVVGNRWIDLFLSAGLSPHRVHHVLPYQGSGFANLATEDTVREVCARGRHRLGAPAEPDLRAVPGRHQALSALPGEAFAAAYALHAAPAGVSPARDAAPARVASPTWVASATWDAAPHGHAAPA